MKSKGFRQIDNEYYLAIMAADLTRAGTKVLLAIIHFTLGYDQRDTADIGLTTFEKLTGLSLPAIRTAIKELIAYDLISLVTPATNRLPAIYKLNKDWRGKAGLPSRGKAGLPSNDAKTLPPDVENFTSRGKVLTPITQPVKKEKKTIKEIPVGDAIEHPAKYDKGMVTLIFDGMRSHMGFPGKLDKDPIPSYGKEGAAIKRMLARGFSHDEILACWKRKVAERGGDFVSMTWVNEDIGKKAAPGAKQQSSRRLPEVYRDVSTHVLDKDGHLVQREDNPNE